MFTTARNENSLWNWIQQARLPLSKTLWVKPKQFDIKAMLKRGIEAPKPINCKTVLDAEPLRSSRAKCRSWNHNVRNLHRCVLYRHIFSRKFGFRRSFYSLLSLSLAHSSSSMFPWWINVLWTNLCEMSSVSLWDLGHDIQVWYWINYNFGAVFNIQWTNMENSLDRRKSL